MGVMGMKGMMGGAAGAGQLVKGGPQAVRAALA